jgi:primary-amine oxidase
MRRGERIFTIAATILVFAATVAVAAVPSTHPLDPLSQQELKGAVATIKAAGHDDKSTRFVFLTLREPAKSAVLSWKPGELAPRQAFAIIKQGNRTYEAVVDLPQSKLESWREVKGVQSSILYEEMQHVTKF